MHRLARFALAALAAGALVPAALLSGGAAWADHHEKVLVIGNTQVLKIRNADTLNGREMSPEARAGHVQDVLAKFLGGQMGRFTTRTWGERVHIYLNGEFALAVTPEDARATGYKSAAALAPVWLKALQDGFDRAHVRGPGAARR